MEWFSGLPGLEKAYVICALFGGGVLIIQLILSLIGGADADVDIDVDMDLDIDHSSDFSFQWLSVQSLSGFFMMFGLIGMTVLHESSQGSFISLICATIAGFVTGWGVYKVFSAMKKMETSGNIDMKNAIGQKGRVYLTVKGDAVGRVEVVVQEKLTVYDAVSEAKEEIETGAQVKVVRLINDKTLSVVRV